MLKAMRPGRPEIGDELHAAVAFQGTIQSGVVDLYNVEEWLPDDTTLRTDISVIAGVVAMACRTALTARLCRRARVRLKLEVAPIFES